jgi:hypothetical protein
MGILLIKNPGQKGAHYTSIWASPHRDEKERRLPAFDDRPT